jgi:4-amino-4-deoxy-L-arabinose transferase-like glycosyltransferase
VLTKGPIGVALPGLIILIYFAWNRELSRLLDRRIVGAGLLFLLVAGPWYGLVSNETRGEWVKAFIGRENLQRFSSPMDQHSGPFYYYLVALPVMFAPWSAFLLAVLWYGARGTGGSEAAAISSETRAHRFLVSWFLAYLIVFSAAATKLPNYIFPLYPALAILTARFLITWRDQALLVPRWVMAAGAGALALVGAVAIGGLLVANTTFPGLGIWAVAGAIPLAGAVVMARALRRDNRHGVVLGTAIACVLFVGVLVTFPGDVVDQQKAPRELVRASGADNPSRDQRLAAYGWFQPSVVYYTGREVAVLESPAAVEAFLAVPTPAYLFVPEPVWREQFAGRVRSPNRVAARDHDFLEKCDVVVISNETLETASR